MSVYPGFDMIPVTSKLDAKVLEVAKKGIKWRTTECKRLRRCGMHSIERRLWLSGEIIHLKELVRNNEIN